jgi:hypothetical protein
MKDDIKDGTIEDTDNPAISKDAEPESVQPEAARPNPSYKLSEKRQGTDKLVFYYSRERRLAKAQDSVRELYNGENKPRFSLLGPLINGKGRAMLFGSILLICVALLVIMIFDPAGSRELSGNRVSVQAISYDGAIIVVLKKKAQKNNPYTGTVEIGASPAASKEQKEQPVFYHRIFFSSESAEEYRFSLPFEADNVVMVLQTEKDSVSMKLKVE